MLLLLAAFAAGAFAQDSSGDLELGALQAPELRRRLAEGGEGFAFPEEEEEEGFTLDSEEGEEEEGFAAQPQEDGFSYARARNKLLTRARRNIGRAKAAYFRGRRMCYAAGGKNLRNCLHHVAKRFRQTRYNIIRAYRRRMAVARHVARQNAKAVWAKQQGLKTIRRACRDAYIKHRNYPMYRKCRHDANKVARANVQKQGFSAQAEESFSAQAEEDEGFAAEDEDEEGFSAGPSSAEDEEGFSADFDDDEEGF